MDHSAEQHVAAANSILQGNSLQSQQQVHYQPNGKLRVAIEKTKLEKLPVEGYVFSYCSDHFGISTIIE